MIFKLIQRAFQSPSWEACPWEEIKWQYVGHSSIHQTGIFVAPLVPGFYTICCPD